MYTVLEVFFTAMEGFVFLFAFSLLSVRKTFIFKDHIKSIFFIFTYTVYTYWITLFFPPVFHTVAIIVLTIFILKYIFNATLFKTTIKVFIILIFMSIIESVITAAALLISQSSIDALVKNIVYYTICSTVSKSTNLICSILVYRFNLTIAWFNDNDEHQSKYKQILIIVSITVFFIILSSTFITPNSENFYLYNIFSLAIYIIIIAAMLSAFREGTKMELLQYANEMKKDNIQQLIEFNEMVAKERHEYKNHLNTIYGLCTLNKQDMSERINLYINNYANNSLTQNLRVGSENDFVDAIINVKFNNAFRKGIEATANFEEPLSLAKIDENVIVTIISNIIENAFESVANSQQEKKFVRVETYVENDNYYISISNNGPMIHEADRKKIFEAGYSTKDNPSKTRGFGLSIVMGEIQRSGGTIEIHSSEEVTEFLISLKVKVQKAAV